ncbi:hypothetical protein [Streptomyces xanthophaeus]|uniref:hypothetical protein n=1 Tax=Streptomyces xanthophaeus TaxID=67385 RepID=UPI00264937CF|nr:hypothetical protein [Streptomyces xanthophaeus]WKD36534.1 hypothetical protein KO717_34440 [Streptomyces xanthophaeus]
MSPNKPPLPGNLARPWQRITIDETDPDTAWIIKLAISAADGWMLGPNGPLKNPAMTLADINRGAVREGLLQLLELGLIDIDTDRLRAAYSFPLRRDTEEPS